METLKVLKFGNKYSKEQKFYVKPVEQMQHVCAMKNLRSANFSNFLNNATIAICIKCKPVGNTATFNSKCKAASNSNLGYDVNALKYKYSSKSNTLVNPIP